MHPWLESKESAQRYIDVFVEKHNISKLLRQSRVDGAATKKKSGGIVRIENFLPVALAEAIHADLQVHLNKEESRAQSRWEQATGDDDEGAGYSDAIQHRFSLADLYEADPSLSYGSDCQAPLSDDALQEGTAWVSKNLQFAGKLFWHLWEPHETVPNFSAACYRKHDFIAPHDDDVLENYSDSEVRAIKACFGMDSTKVKEMTDKEGSESGSESGSASEGDSDMEIGEDEDECGDVVADEYERKVAVVYYLNKGWKESYGGQFLDMEKDKTSLPSFNSAVFFEVPRMHAVLPVQKANLSRMSIFGWWLKKKGAPATCDDPVDKPGEGQKGQKGQKTAPTFSIKVKRRRAPDQSEASLKRTRQAKQGR
jgi:hypothetical protein